jgi:hypothetical protein
MQHDDMQAFSTWVLAYDPQHIHNEDDVETKCVLPLFQHLGYPDSHRRGKYPVPGYQPGRTGRSGRKPEIDQIYFAAADRTDTALVIVEAKHPREQHLTEALEQAQFYGDRLKPLLLVVTNGQRMMVVKRSRYRDDDLVFDGLITDLKDRTQAAHVYTLLNFETVSRLRRQLIDDVTHAQFVELDRALRAYPDIQAILAAGDFTPHQTNKDRTLTVVRPKVAIAGTLPVGFGEGSCEITFSHLLRRGLSISLDHRDILQQLMVGLHTSPAWNTRRFIQPEHDGNFVVQLGQTTTVLSAEEAHDLCACVDDFAGAYRSVIYDAEDTVESWSYPVISTGDGPGFYLLSVRSWLWKDMCRFAAQFEWGKGNTSWHIFEQYAPALRISHPNQDHAFMYGVAHLPGVISRLSNYVHLVYVQPAFIMEWTAEQTGTPWQQSVGAHGLWSAQYTRQWIEQTFLPMLRKQYVHPGTHWEEAVVCENEFNHSYTPLSSIQDTKQLAVYLRDIHLWLTSYANQIIATAPLRDTYAACLHLAQHADPTHINLHYAASKLGGLAGIDQREYASFQYGNDISRIRDVYAAIVKALQTYVDRIHREEYDHPRTADYVMRSIITILEQGQIECSQAILNQAAQAIQVLWRQCRFESRHVINIDQTTTRS